MGRAVSLVKEMAQVFNCAICRLGLSTTPEDGFGEAKIRRVQGSASSGKKRAQT